jgi:DNA repair protein RecN (Recombination protein N)
MLLSLRLRDFVIVDSADIDLGAGFTALTGETGAGKSILLDALGLALGARGDAGVVREGQPRADISARFRSSTALDAWLAARDLAGDPGEVLLRRIVEADGRSRALINGHPATVALLRELGEQLVDIHGQHAAQSLLRAGAQRDLLDAFGSLHAQVAATAQPFERWQAVERELTAARAGGREQALERERLQWQVNELTPLGLAEGEWETLNAEQKRLSHAASLLADTQGAAELLTDGDTPLAGQLDALIARLQPLLALDDRLREPLELLESARIQIDEAASSLAAYARRVDLDPARLDEVESRISAAFAAARKLRIAPESLARELVVMLERLAELERAQDLDALERRCAETRAQFDKAAALLSAERRKAARKLADGVSTLLAELGMGGTRLDIALEPCPPSACGVDAVEFRIAGHASGTARPLARVASGGELSRIGLAIAVLAAQSTPVPTLIFDEADAGVGGAVAEVIGNLMRKLGASRQVLCVTHLPQVAARSHQQLKVSREHHAHGVLSRVQVLGRTERIEEIARMLGGVEITATTRKHAREMLAAQSD